MLALFGLVACIAFDADLIWWLAGFICLLLDAKANR
jgi:hypothetical protein